MNKKWLISLGCNLIIVVLLLFISACGPEEMSEPTLTPTLQDALLGIEEPINIEGISVQILDAYTQDDLENKSPESSNTTILTIEFPASIDEDWIAQNSLLVCGGEEYSAISYVYKTDEEGHIKTIGLNYEVQRDIDYMTCVFQIKGNDISLAIFFE